MEEEFEYIKGYENLYKINRKGEIYSCWYRKVMSPLINESGYYYVHLKKEGKREKSFIHRLLGKQYIENPEEKPEIDHIDRNNKNNILSNLRWVNRQENRRNRADYSGNLTEEQKQERKEKLKQYKTEWARKKRESLKNNEMSLSIN